MPQRGLQQHKPSLFRFFPTPDPQRLVLVTDLRLHQAEEFYGPTSICHAQEGMASHEDVAPVGRIHTPVRAQDAPRARNSITDLRNLLKFQLQNQAIAYSSVQDSPAYEAENEHHLPDSHRP